MESREVETLRGAYEGWNRGDIESILAASDPDVVFRMSGLFPGLEPVYRGYEGVRMFWDQFRETWQQISIEPEEIVQRGDLVLALFRFRGIGRDGIEVERPFAHLWTTREGRFVEMQAYADQAIAREALKAGAAR
jgi:ketosteroid isomerase-like protein